MTFQEMLAGIRGVKPCSPAQLKRYMRGFKIKPTSFVRQRPQRYPDESLGIILKGLGFEEAAKASSDKIVSLRTLQRERARAKARRRAKRRKARAA